MCITESMFTTGLVSGLDRSGLWEFNIVSRKPRIIVLAVSESLFHPINPGLLR